MKLLLAKLKRDMDVSAPYMPSLSPALARVNGLLERFYLAGEQFNFQRFVGFEFYFFR